MNNKWPYTRDTTRSITALLNLLSLLNKLEVKAEYVTHSTWYSEERIRLNERSKELREIRARLDKIIS